MPNAAEIDLPDIDGLIAGSPAPGPLEAQVRLATSDMLAVAAIAGDLQVGARGWQRHRDELVGAFLTAGDVSRPAATRLEAIEREPSSAPRSSAAS